MSWARHYTTFLLQPSLHSVNTIHLALTTWQVIILIPLPFEAVAQRYNYYYFSI